ncbi:hypothetical protein FRB99_001859, partial [Tulasnella sp. 403]
FVKSTRNIVIECSWRPLVKKLIRNVQNWWADGRLEAGFIDGDRTHKWLADWLWVPLIQKEVNNYVDQFNDHVVRKQMEKVGPSNCSPNYAFDHPGEYGGVNNYIPLDVNVIDSLREGHAGERAVRFFPPWAEQIAAGLFQSAGLPQVTVDNAWTTFVAMRNTFVAEVADFEALHKLDGDGWPAV